jgi:eukaryotic-like serine/threonine-protein kinase
MTRSRRSIDALLTLLALLILTLPYVAGVFGNDLPQLLPTEVRTQAPLYFAVLVVVMLAVSGVLARMRRVIDEGGPGAHSRRLRRLNAALTLVLGVVGAAISVLSGLVVPLLPVLAEATRAYGPWLALGALALVIVLPLAADWLQTRAKLEKKDRTAFLRQLAQRYDNYLDDPLQRAVRAELGLLDTATALHRPGVTVETLDGDDARQTVQVLVAPDATLRAVYEADGGQLLILGAPGAGKSTQLYELGRELVKRTQGHGQEPMPVILDLSAWAANKDPLKKWLIDAIVDAYGVRKKIATRWVTTRQIAPLLDALDVMAESDRPRCIKAINTYRAQHPSQPLVVCSRLEEYEHLRTKLGATLGIQRAVTLQPLSDAAIDEALASGGQRQATLRAVVARDAQMQDALRSPLILSLVVLTYSDLRGEDIPRIGDLATWRRQLFRRYTNRMLGDERIPGHRPGTERQPIHYDEDTINQTLIWLGYALRAHNRGTFYLDQLQVSWLPDTITRRRHHRLTWALRWGIALAFPLVVSPLLVLGSKPIPLVSNLVGWGILLAIGFFAGLLATDSLPIEPVARFKWSANAIVGIVGVFAAVILVSLLAGLSLGLLSLRFVSVSNDVVRQLGGGVRGWLLLGLGIGLIAGPILSWGGLEFVRQYGVEEQDIKRADEGIRRSTQFALRTALLLVMTGILLGWLGSVLGPVGGGILFLVGWENDASIMDPSRVLIGGSILGSLSALMLGLYNGGAAALRHFSLRLALRRSGVVPPRLGRFLDEACSLVLLRRVGGGYQFIHQLLRDYFADQYRQGET